MRALLLAATLVVATGCSIRLTPVSEPPPTKVAAVDDAEDSIELSKGVAFAVECNDSCEGNCLAGTLVAADPSVVAVRKAFHLAGTAQGGGAHNPTTFFLAGLRAGKTDLTLKSDCTDRTYSLTVVE